MEDIIKGVIAYKAIDHYFTSADARLASRDNQEHLKYLKERDKQLFESVTTLQEKASNGQSYESYENRQFQSQMAQEERYHESNMAWEAQQHEKDMQQSEHEMRLIEIKAQERINEQKLITAEQIAELKSRTQIYNADRDREARLLMHAKELDHTEQLEVRRLRVQENIAKQEKQLQLYLSELGMNSRKEIERFKALATRETQILLARENAQNMLQDRMVQESMKTFPLDISPIVLLQNRSHSLTGLLRFSSLMTCESGLPSVAQVYNDVRAYSNNPEPLNIFIAPIHIDSKIKNREQLSQQIWDSIYMKIEKFFTENYNRRGPHSVILYPTSWKSNTTSGQHASETLYFFLKDLPSIVIEPRFDGHTLSLMLSMWNIGYTTPDHIRTEMNTGVNLDAMLIKAAYDRSKQSLELIKGLGDNASHLLANKTEEFLHNIEYYETLNIAEKIESEKMDEISTFGIYNLFHIDPIQDMTEVAMLISEILCINLAVLSDIHHLQATDRSPKFPSLFKHDFPQIFKKRDFREAIFKCYKRAHIFLRNEDSRAVDPQFRGEMEHVREMQIANLEKTLELIDEEVLKHALSNKLVNYAHERMNIQGLSGDQLWATVIERMTIDDIPFFREILPNIDDRRIYKRVDKKISDLRRMA